MTILRSSREINTLRAYYYARSYSTPTSTKEEELNQWRTWYVNDIIGKGKDIVFLGAYKILYSLQPMIIL